MFTLTVIALIFAILAILADWYTTIRAVNSNTTLAEDNYLFNKIASLLKTNVLKVVGTILGAILVGLFYILINLDKTDTEISGLILASLVLGIPHAYVAYKNYKLLKEKDIM